MILIKPTIFTKIGASNHSNEIRDENDYYATEPYAIDILMEVEKFNNRIWECAVGQWHLGNRLLDYGYHVKGSDIINRGGGQTEIIDFLNTNRLWNGDIITNPPYKYANEFIEKAVSIIPTNNKVAMLLKLTFLESKSRKELFNRCGLKTLYVSSSRLICVKNGDFKKYKNKVIAYGWYVFEKGFNKDPIIKWIN